MASTEKTHTPDMQAALEAAHAFVHGKLSAMKAEKGLVGVWTTGFRSGWEAASRSTSEPVAWMIYDTANDEWWATLIREVAAEQTANGATVHPLISKATQP